MRSAFIAYPAKPPELAKSIAAAAAEATKVGFQVTPWPEADEPSVHIPTNVRESIDAADVFVCDITYPNPNVYYEAGFAMGRGKTVVPTVNVAFADAQARVRREGLFDSISYKSYENSGQLSSLLQALPSSNLIDLYGRALNKDQPLFLLDAFRKTDFRNAIVSAVKDAKAFYRSFDPVEVPRFSAVNMIGEISSSSGIIVPILADHIDDAERHNLRASFLAGLCHGSARPILLLRVHAGEVEAGPIDYNEDIATVRDQADIEYHVRRFLESLSSSPIQRSAHVKTSRTSLQLLSLGASAAENEFRTLEDYFVETAEFLRTIRGESAVVAGRKGSGKTAIFFRVRDVLRSRRRSSITDLKPESHQLSLFREQVLKLLDVGVFDHTLAAFWYFLVMSELVLTMRRDFEFRSKFDSHALEALEEIDVVLTKVHALEQGDFTSRINRLGSYIVQEIERLKKRGEKLSPERLTNVVFREAVGDLKRLLLTYTDAQTELWFLFDNIDKGWPASGVSPFDVRMVRLLLEALEKVARDLNVQNRTFTSVVFLRNDILELLINATPDRGKAEVTRIDWTDRAKLRQLVLKRLQASSGAAAQDFQQLWGRYFPAQVGVQDAFEYCVDHSLMRPRFLINILEYSVANAINRGHMSVHEEDMVLAVRQHSNYLVDDFGYEIRDVSGITADILYSFVGQTQLLTKEEIEECLTGGGVAAGQLETATHLLLWYGVLGLATEDGSSKYIWDFEYNQKRLSAEIRLLLPDVLYVTNPALHVALSS